MILNEAARIAIKVSKHMDAKSALAYQEVLRDIVLSSREMSEVQEAKLNDIARRLKENLHTDAGESPTDSPTH